MFELIKINDSDYYIECPSKIGLVKACNSSNEVLLIDSGFDRDIAKKILKIVDAEDWKIKAIYNTHSHADHIGGNKFLQDKTGCKIYSYGLETSFSTMPVLEPIGLYGGNPFKEISNKFLCAQGSVVDQIADNSLPENINLINLAGHSFNMVGYLTSSGTAYIADSISSEETLNKYGIIYIWNYKEALQTLERLKTIPAKIFVPSHSAASTDISDLIDLNIASINRVIDNIIDICSQPCCFEEILKMMFDRFAMDMTIQQYVLIGSTLKSYLSILYSEGYLKYYISDNRLLWLKS